MPLKDMLFTVGRRTGNTQWRTDPIAKEFLRDLINEAANEIYESIDVQDYMRETVIELQTGQVVSLPSDLGVLRGVRRHDTIDHWSLMPNQVAYHNNGWKYENNLFKSQAVKPLKQNITSEGILTLTVSEVESVPVIVTIVGSNSNSSRITEEVTLNATTVNTVNTFETIESITKTQPNVFDITIKDTASVEISVIPNFYLASLYRHVEVLEFVFQSDISTRPICFDIIYKPRLIPLWEDNDPFMIPDFDSAVSTKAIALHFEDQEGKETKAILLANKSKKLVDNKRVDRLTSQTRPIDIQRRVPYIRRSNIRASSPFW